jgi:hypothetical protein
MYPGMQVSPPGAELPSGYVVRGSLARETEAPRAWYGGYDVALPELEPVATRQDGPAGASEMGSQELGVLEELAPYFEDDPSTVFLDVDAIEVQVLTDDEFDVEHVRLPVMEPVLHVRREDDIDD